MVKFWKELSENVPVAMNCVVVPGAILAVTGVTDSETSTGGGPGSFIPQPQNSTGKNMLATIVIHERNLFFIASNMVLVNPIVKRKLKPEPFKRGFRIPYFDSRKLMAHWNRTVNRRGENNHSGWVKS
ncbi:MAG: hypothetical protein ACYDBV_08480 [Nitrospiria bacterium]